MKKYILSAFLLLGISVSAQSDLGANFTLGSGIDLYNITDEQVRLRSALVTSGGGGIHYNISPRWKLEFSAMLAYHQLKLEHAEREAYEQHLSQDLSFDKSFFGLNLPLHINYYQPLNEKKGLKIFSGLEWSYLMGPSEDKIIYNPAMTHAAKIGLIYPPSSVAALGGIGYYMKTGRNNFLEINLKATIGLATTTGNYYFSDKVIYKTFEDQVAIQESTFSRESSNISSSSSYIQLTFQYGFQFSGRTEKDKKEKEVKAGPAYNTVFVEAGGPGGLYSVNYDRILGYIHSPGMSKYFGIRVGATYREDMLVYDMHTQFLFPASFNIMVGGKKHRAELSPGVTMVKGDWQGVHPIYNVFAGYRYQQEDGGLFFRAGYTPMYYEKGFSMFMSKFTHWGGISVGKSF